MTTCERMKVISVNNVVKGFPQQGRALLRERLRAWAKPKHDANRFYALKNVSFEIERGESVAIIGANGSGKSTMLSLVCGLTVPDSGTVDVSGRVAALLDL